MRDSAQGRPRLFQQPAALKFVNHRWLVEHVLCRQAHRVGRRLPERVRAQLRAHCGRAARWPKEARMWRGLRDPLLDCCLHQINILRWVQ